MEELLLAYRDATQRGDIPAAESLGLEFLVLASERAAKEPSDDLRLNAEAHCHEEYADWPKAEAAYRQALELAVAQKNHGLEFKAHDDLSSLYGLLGDSRRALEETQAALQAARRTGIGPLLTMALESRARSLLEAGDASAALAAANEIVEVCGDDKMYDLQRARGLVIRARSAVELKDVASAEADQAVAMQILAPRSDAAMFAGVQSGLAGWWEVTSRIRSIHQDHRGAAEALSKAVEFRRHVSQLPQLEGPYKFNALAETLHRYARAALAAGDGDTAVHAFVESRSIKHSIGLPPCGTAG